MAAARRALRERRIGHLGTLDPFATGLLVLLVGRATRLARFIAGEPKRYDAVVRFGTETATDDGTGEVVREAALPDPARLPAAVATLTGRLSQLPPAYSAKQVGGERAYAAAREGRPLELAAVDVTVHRWTVHEADAARARVTIECGGGTYIRALARDLGRALDSAAHLEALRRTASGPFDVRDALPFASVGDAASRLLPPLVGLPELPRELLDDAARRRVLHGNAVAASVPGERAALVDGDGAIVAIADRLEDAWQPRVVLQDA